MSRKHFNAILHSALCSGRLWPASFLLCLSRSFQNPHASPDGSLNPLRKLWSRYPIAKHKYLPRVAESPFLFSAVIWQPNLDQFNAPCALLQIGDGRIGCLAGRKGGGWRWTGIGEGRLDPPKKIGQKSASGTWARDSAKALVYARGRGVGSLINQGRGGTGVATGNRQFYAWDSMAVSNQFSPGFPRLSEG
ncbi:hypothetical protein DFP72DRAFT_1151483 [Ephemerocybe angulata]|uniref:Uncharacterized protein n=1 Tax=Ephemerocybe angulata TaxID=980116 RepID=A0A8H6ICE4_9AGAR|nr:hypothetical protein DFP72DRAFT_1151483 [Tulosesus angulatus]